MTRRIEDGPLVWITGATGFLAPYIAQAFQRDGWRVAGIARTKKATEEGPGDGFFAVPLDMSGLRILLNRTGPPTAVFHSAGSGTVGETISDPRRALFDTVGTAVEVVQFLIRHCPDTVFIYPSSCSVYGDRPKSPILEDAPNRPISPYGAYKAMVEVFCLSAAVSSGLRTGIIRYFSVYGPGQRKQLLWDLCRKSTEGDAAIELAGTGSETRDFLHAEDAARLSVLVARRVALLDSGADPLIVNGGTGRGWEIRQVVDAVADALGVRADVVFNGIRRPGDPQHYEASVEKASSLGFTPRWRFEDGAQEYCRWFRASRPGGLHIVELQ